MLLAFPRGGNACHCQLLVTFVLLCWHQPSAPCIGRQLHHGVSSGACQSQKTCAPDLGASLSFMIPGCSISSHPSSSCKQATRSLVGSRYFYIYCSLPLHLFPFAFVTLPKLQNRFVSRPGQPANRLMHAISYIKGPTQLLDTRSSACQHAYMFGGGANCAWS